MSEKAQQNLTTEPLYPTQLLPQLTAPLLSWFESNARELPWRKTTAPYPVWISEIMLQQTRVEAVLPYYIRFLNTLPDINALAAVPQDVLYKLWEGLGYYSRARNLQRAARTILEQFGGVFPSAYDDIVALPGIGPYTAGAIASICFGRPTPAVDGNVLRVISRVCNSTAPIDKQQTKAAMTKQLAAIYPTGRCGTFTQALMELGALVCTPKSPRCESCPWKALCLARQNNTVAQLPIKAPKKEKRVEEKTVFLFLCNHQLALQKRHEPGLLHGMWQFPNTTGSLSVPAALQFAAANGLQPVSVEDGRHLVHVFTHIRWEMTGYIIRCNAMPEGFIWATRQELQEIYALPTAFRQFLD